MKVTSQIRSRLFDVDVLTGEARLGFAWRGLIATNASPGYMLFVAPDFCRTEVIVLGVIIHVLFVAAR